VRWRRIIGWGTGREEEGERGWGEAGGEMEGGREVGTGGGSGSEWGRDRGTTQGEGLKSYGFQTTTVILTRTNALMNPSFTPWLFSNSSLCLFLMAIRFVMSTSCDIWMGRERRERKKGREEERQREWRGLIETRISEKWWDTVLSIYDYPTLIPQRRNNSTKRILIEALQRGKLEGGAVESTGMKGIGHSCNNRETWGRKVEDDSFESICAYLEGGEHRCSVLSLLQPLCHVVRRIDEIMNYSSQ
jgi:hypothetical protein